MKRKLIFLILAALLLAPWPVAYAYGNDTVGSAVEVTAAAPATAPQMNAYGHAIGGVTHGDLFYVDTAESQTDTSVTLYITNTDELIHTYRYLTLNIGVYAQTNTGWEKAATGSGEPFPDTYITMFNSRASFDLPGCQRYKITIDKGCFYCYGTTEARAGKPEFYLTAE